MVTSVNPPSLGKPIGYSNGIRAGGLLFISGQIGARGDADGSLHVVSPHLVEQFEKALENVLEVVRAAGGRPESVVEMTIFVTDVAAYRAGRQALGPIWKRLMGKHFPAMTLVEASRLVEAGAKVEIRAIASLE